MPPSMSSSEALVIWMLRIAMKAPIMHARTAIQSLMLARGAEMAPEAAAAVALAMGRPSRARSSVLASVRSSHLAAGRLGVDARGHRHARPHVTRGRAPRTRVD